MQIQKINNQQPQFGHVARVKVSPIFLEDLKVDATFWKGMKKAPFRFNIYNIPDEKGLFDVTILSGVEKKLVDKVDKKRASLEKRILKARTKFLPMGKVEKFYQTRGNLIEDRDCLIKQMEAKAQPLEVKSSQEISEIPGFEAFAI